jgi:hypothetical protein
LAIREDDILEAHLHQELGDGDTGGTSATGDDFELRQRTTVSLQALIMAARVTMAVPCWSSWKIGISVSFQATFDFKAAGSGDVFEVDTTKAASEQFDGVDDVVDILGTDAKRECIDITEGLEQDALAFHDRHAGFGADVTQAEDSGAVGDNRNEIPAAGQGVGEIDILLDGRQGSATPGVGKRQVVDGVDGAGAMTSILPLRSS